MKLKAFQDTYGGNNIDVIYDMELLPSPNIKTYQRKPKNCRTRLLL